jgi:hypothetical protein
MKHAKALSKINGKSQTVTIDLDARKYRIVGRAEKKIPSGVHIKVKDTITGETLQGTYDFVFNTLGVAEGGSLLLWDNKRTATIEIDPIVGAMVVK